VVKNDKNQTNVAELSNWLLHPRL